MKSVYEKYVAELDTALSWLEEYLEDESCYEVGATQSLEHFESWLTKKHNHFLEKIEEEQSYESR